jgi:hypothetical protein
MNPNVWSTQPTVVKSQSTWVPTSKNSPTNSNDTIDQVDTHVWSTHGQSLVKHHSNPSDPRCLPELLPRSPKFT